MWNASKVSYRKRYYLNEKPFQTAETIFGKCIADKLEVGDAPDGIVKYEKPEYRVDVELDDGLKLLGYLDGFNPKDNSIVEIKTGHLTKDGKVPWNKLKVRKHKQLVFYSLLVQLKHGSVHPETTLQWFETAFQYETREFDGHILKGKTKNLALTGRVETFKRNIEQWEIDKMKEEIIEVAHAISNDYTEWQAKNK
jgi:hypothetical protein